MNIFQKIMNWFKRLRLPEWLSRTIETLMTDIIYPMLVAIGKEAWNLIQELVIKASKMDATPKEKFDFVVSEFKETYNDPSISDRVLNLAIETAYNYLRKMKFIK